MNYINDEKTVITLPVPLGSELHRVVTKCGDFCWWQQELFDKIFPPSSDGCRKGRCGRDKPCHTVDWQISKTTLTLGNLESVLRDYGVWVFSTEAEARTRMKEVLADNRKVMRELGFVLREDGYGMVDTSADCQRNC